MIIQASRYAEFEDLWRRGVVRPGLRYGQAFYQYMQFEKSSDPSVEEIYFANYPTVVAWIRARLDTEN